MRAEKQAVEAQDLTTTGDDRADTRGSRTGAPAGGTATDAGERLAIFGGPRAVPRPVRDRWRRIGLRELRAILYSGLRDVNTVSDGKGPVERFEKRFARLCGTRYALAMNSGTATLHSAYFAVGIGPGSEVIVPAYTFFATAMPLLQLGAVPVFCDVDERTLTADPADVERRITPRTRAIAVVHVWGNPARMDDFQDLARKHRLALIEDVSHAPGARYKGRAAGSWGDVGCFSLQGAKAVSGGEAGIAVTDDPLLYDRMLALGHNGRTQNGQAAGTFALHNLSLGLKYRAHLYAVLLANGGLDRLPELNRLRKRNYQMLVDGLAGCNALEPITTYPDAERGGFLSFVFRYHSEAAGGWTREAFVKAVQAEGVPLSVERYTAIGGAGEILPEAPLFRSLDVTGLGGPVGEALTAYRKLPPAELPVTRRLARELVALPPLTKVPERYVRQCVRALRKVAAAAPRIEDVRRA